MSGLGKHDDAALDVPTNHYLCSRLAVLGTDSSQYWVQFGENYMRQGRRNLDGYRMYYNPEMLEDLFDAGEVFDKARPTPVPEM